jgi:hypothetical protein
MPPAEKSLVLERRARIRPPRSAMGCAEGPPARRVIPPLSGGFGPSGHRIFARVEFVEQYAHRPVPRMQRRGVE